nr:HEAT repeat domain-containing protein [Nodosilinea sp. TSF1-S3]
MSPLYGRSPRAFASSTAGQVVAGETANQCSDAEVQYWVERWRRSHLPAAPQLRACASLAVPPLIDLLNDDNLSLTARGLTARLLAQIGSIEAVNALLAAAQNSDLQPSIQQAFRVLNSAKPEAVPTLVEALYAEPSTTATTAAIALGQLGSEPAILALLAALSSESHQTAAFAGLGATNPNSRVALTTLVTALDSDSELVQVGAAYGLAAMGAGAEAAVPALVNRLEQGRPWEPAIVIHDLENPDGFFLEAHPNSSARVMMVYALGEINPGNTRSLTALLQILLIRNWERQELDENVKDAAIEALKKLTSEDLPALLNTEIFSYPEIVELIDQIVDFDLDLELVNLLRNPNQSLEHRVVAVRVLGDYKPGSEAAFTALLNLVQDSDAPLRLRWEAALALGYIGDPRAIPSLRSLLVEMNYAERLRRYYDSFLGFEPAQPEDELAAYFFSALGQLEFEKTYQLSACIDSWQGYNSVCTIDKSQASLENDPLVWFAFRHPEMFKDIVGLGYQISAAGVGQVAANVSNYQASSTPVICRSRLVSRWLWRCR